mgnify:CR=1 FL=1|tara:strand:+ start:61 stop:783 length:723 start_codon:yes stop_codon:yes gene_type:complete
MNIKSLNLKVIIGLIYLAIILIALYFLFSVVDINDLTSYEFIRSNKDVILRFKDNNFLFLTLIFFTISVIWTLILGFATPLLLFSGFVFGKWWGIIIVLTSTTIGATLLYILVGFFFKDFIEEKLAPKFSKLKEFFSKNDIIYFMSFRFMGGGGTPYGIQNILPVLFNMPIKNYIIATFLGSMPSMFVTVSLGHGIESIIDKNAELSIFTVLTSPEIYLPILGFFVILLIAFFIRKFYFK